MGYRRECALTGEAKKLFATSRIVISSPSVVTRTLWYTPTKAVLQKTLTKNATRTTFHPDGYLGHRLARSDARARSALAPTATTVTSAVDEDVSAATPPSLVTAVGGGAAGPVPPVAAPPRNMLGSLSLSTSCAIERYLRDRVKIAQLHTPSAKVNSSLF